MSAPTPAPGDDRPREGYYPDPSIPGYVRYWNGASWVAGTSRPAPKDGEPLAPPPGARPSVEETGPHFFDEDPVEDPPPAAASQHGSRPESATAWGADRSGPAGAPDQRVAWPGTARGADPRVPHARQPAPPADGTADGGGQGDAAPAPARTPGSAPAQAPGSVPASAAAPASGSASAPAPASGSASGEAEAEAGNTFVFRRPAAGPQGSPAPGGSPAPAEDEGTMTFRAVTPRTGPQAGGSGSATGSGSGSGPGVAAGQAGAPPA
ncbi:DUF2510 domain-containing protein, partial [Streptomyces coelicoflavus]|uniref:DUF2510 domain-containing protein n=1 Tax=Streptomyces coelicoflavus TaxID=285562 RepID=UPI00363FB12F